MAIAEEMFPGEKIVLELKELPVTFDVSEAKRAVID
jgi:hypothetical protein